MHAFLSNYFVGLMHLVGIELFLMPAGYTTDIIRAQKGEHKNNLLNLSETVFHLCRSISLT